MRKLLLIAMILTLSAASAYATPTATPTATATATQTATATSTPTPIMNCQNGVGPNFCAPNSAPTPGAILIADANAWNGQPRAMLWSSSYSTINWDGDLGTVGNTAVMPMIAGMNGHFVSLSCTATLTGACTTGPTINVVDITTPAAGTAVSPTTTVATVASSAETLVFLAGETIGLKQTAATGTCTVPRYACSAVLAFP